ncbi:MAG TPA: hypothetical protein VK849_04475, partial [Longimicrobiales bacterium]|nr:hypothetical protein [Longimicrobiales bacterium]
MKAAHALRLAALALFPLPPAALGAQEDTTAAEAWDVTLARGETREVDFTTDVGTWMSVDVSPDGRWVVFDLLGHVYRVSTTGGE